jgi:hemoglobin/transferrin/lactoferrin receptor protein
MKINIILIGLIGLLVGAFGPLYSQQITIKDATTLETLPGVVIESKGKSVITNERGKADISQFDGSDAVQFLMIGYEKYVFTYAQLAASNFEIYLFSSGLFANEVVVSASKFEEKAEDVAQQIAVIDRKKMQFQSSSTTADVLQQSGMVHVQKSQQGGGSPVIRGFEANKVMIVVDGVRMNNAIYRGGHLQDVITIDNNMLEKVEVSFGPGSVIYGSDALGGVMHFYTRTPKFSTTDKSLFEGGVMARYGSVNNEITTNLHFNIGGKKWFYMYNGTYSKFGDLRQGKKPMWGDTLYEAWQRNEYVERINGIDSILKNNDPSIQIGSGYRQFDMFHKIAYKQSDKVLHTLSVQMSTSSDLPRYDRLTQYRSGALRFAEWYYGPQKRKQITYSLQLSAPTQMYDESRITLAYQAIEQSRVNRTRGKNALTSQIEKVTVLSVNADFSKVIKGGSEIRYGLEGYTNAIQSKAFTRDIVTGDQTNAATRYADGGSSFTGLAAYVTHSWEITDKLVFTDGIRFNHVRLQANFNDTTFFPFPFRTVDQDNIATTGSIGLVARPNETWKLSLLGSTGFRAPNVDDLSKVFDSTTATRDENGNLSELGTLIIPNPNLKPEFTYNIDGGLSKTFLKKATLSLNGFYTIYRDALTTEFSTLNGNSIALFNGDSAQVVTLVNKTNAYLFGASTQFIYQINKHFEFNTTASYTVGQVKEDTEIANLDHIPPLFGKTSLSYQSRQWRCELWSQYNTKKPLKDYRLGAEDNESNATPDGMPSWITLNIRGSFQMNNHIRIQLAVENIMDSNYRQFASNISAPGRNIVLTLRGNL